MKILIWILLASLAFGKIVWPPPPEKARIELVRIIERPEDLGIKKGIWERVKEVIFGKKRLNRILKPAGVYVDDELFVVTDQAVGGVLIWDLKRKKVRRVLGFPSPVDVDVDLDKRVFVSDSVLGKVVLLSMEGDVLGTLGEGLLKRPTGLVIDKKRKKVYVSDTLANKILIFDLGGKKIGEIKGNFNRPTYLNLDKEGNLYVSDSLNAKVRIFSPEGKEITSFGKRGTKIGTFANPRGIAVDRDGHIYVSDTLFSAVQIFNRKGELLLVVGRYGSEEGKFAFPMDIFIRGDMIYVADSYNSRIVVLRYLGGE